MVDKIILGTVQFGLKYGINNFSEQMTQRDVFQILNIAKANKINTLDTAAAYGLSELRIGKYIKKNKEDPNFIVITKFDLKARLSPIESLDQSLLNLNLNSVEIIMFHNYDDFKTLSKSDLNELLKLKGLKFQKLGISLYNNEEVELVLNLDLFDVVQIPFNCLDNANLRGETLQRLKSKNIETHTRSVFLQGLFFMDRNKIESKLMPLRKYLYYFDEVANNYKIEKGVLALQYVLSKTYIDRVLIGVDSIHQINQNISMIESELPSCIFEEIDKIFVNEINLLNPAMWNK